MSHESWRDELRVGPRLRLTLCRQIKRPSLSYSTGAPLFYQAPPQLHEATKPNLAKTLAELKLDEIVITDPNLPFTVTVEVKFAQA
jgi:ubiquitin-activating enzyme E1 C